MSQINNPAGTPQITLGYDVRGNVTSKNSQAFVFDASNRLNQVTGQETYRYDGQGRRVQTTDADTKSMFWQYSQAGQVTYVSDTRRSRNTAYLYLGNSLVAMRHEAWGTGTVTVSYQHTDALGSPVAETDATGVVTKRNTYAPYGEAYNSSIDGPGYTGHVMDQATGLTYMQQRYYDPAVGKFLSADPVTALDNGDMRHFNRYAYGFNNPYKFSDPDGRCPTCITGAIGAGIGLVAGLAVEGYRQFEAGKFDGTSLAIEGGKGALVGGLTGLTGGAIGASTLSVSAKVALTGTSAFAIGAGGDAAGALTKGQTPTVNSAAVAGAANVVGAAVGAIAKPAAIAAATTTTAAVKSNPVTSLTGRVFYVVNTPASTSTNQVAAEAVQGAAGEAASAATSVIDYKQRQH